MFTGSTLYCHVRGSLYWEGNNAEIEVLWISIGSCTRCRADRAGVRVRRWLWRPIGIGRRRPLRNTDADAHVTTSTARPRMKEGNYAQTRFVRVCRRSAHGRSARQRAGMRRRLWWSDSRSDTLRILNEK